MKRHILITNDDGIQSRFLHAIAHALEPFYRVFIAAPKSQQSWIGRAVTRNGKVKVNPFDSLPWTAWEIDGTPTDCVNIAIGKLLESRPVAVVSGINVGYNTTTQLIYSSGTVAGALEGAFWRLPAFAVSQEIPDRIFMQAAYNNGHLPPEWVPVLKSHATHAADFIRGQLEKDDRGIPCEDAIVHNLNYPASPVEPLQLVRTIPAPLGEMSFFEKDYDDGYEFHFNHGSSPASDSLTDREALAGGQVSHSILNFSALGRDLNN